MPGCAFSTSYSISSVSCGRRTRSGSPRSSFVQSACTVRMVGQRQVVRVQLQVDLAFEVARDDPGNSCRLPVVRAPLGGDDPLVLGVDESEAHAHRAAELGKRVGRRVQRAALDPTDIGLRHA